MDFDPDFEFDAPRWFDFAKVEDEGEFSFSDSWFENHHPLHEPKVPQQKSNKPLLKKRETKSGPSRKAHTKPSQANKGKGKKYLDITTIRTKRGEHGPKTCREQKEKSRRVRETPGERSNSGAQIPSEADTLNAEDGCSTAGEFKCNPNFAFDPPWSNSPSITGNDSESVYQFLEANDKQETSSQVKENATQQVKSELPSIRSALSPSIMESSPKRSVSTKDVSRAAQKRPPGGKKRRLLPAIPPQKKKQETNTSHVKAACARQKPRPANDVRKPEQSSAPLDSDTLTSPCPSETTAAPDEDASCTHNLANDGSGQSDDLDTLFNYHNKQSAHGVGRKTESRDVPPGAKQASPSPEQGEMSIEEMLKMHNQKILATKCKYDENGRKIRSATPTFCPAPDKDSKTAKRAKWKSTAMSAQPSSNASSTAAATSNKLAHCSDGVNSLSTCKQEKESGTPISTPTLDLPTQSNGTTGKAVVNDNRAGCSGRGESQAVQTQTTKRETAQVKPSCLDTSNKHVVTGQKRAGSSTEGARVTAKQKRRSCMPSIGVNANTGVVQASSGTQQNQKGVGKCPMKQKRRSCIAGTWKARVFDAEKELEELIQRHNSQIVAKKS